MLTGRKGGGKIKFSTVFNVQPVLFQEKEATEKLRVNNNSLQLKNEHLTEQLQEVTHINVDKRISFGGT